MLIWLWKRLSNGGAEASVSGRALRRFPEREIEGLLRARVLRRTKYLPQLTRPPQIWAARRLSSTVRLPPAG